MDYPEILESKGNQSNYKGNMSKKKEKNLGVGGLGKKQIHFFYFIEFFLWFQEMVWFELSVSL